MVPTNYRIGRVPCLEVDARLRKPRNSSVVVVIASALSNSRPCVLAWLHRFFAFATTEHHVAFRAARALRQKQPHLRVSRARVLAAGRPLLAAAQRSHEVRDNLTLEQILDMIVAIATIHSDTRYIEPILQAALDGLRPTDVSRITGHG